MTVTIKFITLQTTFLAPFMRDSSNQSNPISDLVEVHEEPVAKWRNLQVCILASFNLTLQHLLIFLFLLQTLISHFIIILWIGNQPTTVNVRGSKTMESDVSNICSINDATAAYQDFNKTNTHYGAITVKASFYTKILNTIFLTKIYYFIIWKHFLNQC